jgi:protein Tex
MNFIQLLANTFNKSEKAIQLTLELLQNGATMPFIARYRKEMTEGMDEVQLEKFQDLLEENNAFVNRRNSIISSLTERNLLTDLLLNAFENASNIHELEDLYLPFKQKRKTRATVAKEKGLEPLAKMIMKQELGDLHQTAKRFFNKEVEDENAALAGARDIIAEWISENVPLRAKLRTQFEKHAVLTTKVAKGKELDGQKFKDYFNFSEPLYKIPSHRFLAVMRGNEEGFLSFSALPDEEKALQQLNYVFVKNNSESAEQVQIAAKDSYKRLIAPSLENEIIQIAKDKADIAAIQVFAENLRQLLMLAPLGEKRVMGIDPGFRSGCKIVCLDKDGALLHNENIYPHAPQNQEKQAMAKISSLIGAYKIEAVAIGNGTAGRETESFIQRMRFDEKIQIFVVSENGASVYSASKIARDEFPQYDVTVRGAVSIGRRLQDPLAELVKIEPKSIGVGQYQHDVNQQLLTQKLNNVVVSCVNQVGVNLNTASHHLLAHVSGIGPSLAQAIVQYRSENGMFTNRASLKNVPRMGAKAFEQAAGFLRIQEGDNPLDNSAVHPERYALVNKMAKDLKLNVSQLIGDASLKSKIDLKNYVNDQIGIPTLEDILSELEKPGRDPRKKIKMLVFDASVRKPSDLQIGMILPGIVTNITAFGAFVDVGVKQDGLVHVSQMADRFVSNPLEVVNLHQHVKVKVMEVDLERKRIAFSMKEVAQ